MYQKNEFEYTAAHSIQQKNNPGQPVDDTSGLVAGPVSSTNGPFEPVPGKPKKFAAARFLAACLCCALIGGVAGAGGAMLAYYASNGSSTSATTIYEGTRPTIVSMAAVTGRTILSATEIYNTNLPSIVGINGSVTTNVWGQTVSNPVSGSGFVISADGYIITNYHVINGVSNIKVFFSDETNYDATVVGGDEDHDIAVLKINAKGLRPVVLGDSSAIQVGENVYAVGNPLGELTFTLTGGYVSAKDREITMSSGMVMNMIQTDAAINSGNSGGPLFDQYGQVVGIVSAKLSSSSNSSSSVEGLGFAIPLDDVKEMISGIIQNGYVAGRPNLGVLMETVQANPWFQGSTVAGCRVLAVLDGSCAAQAGLQAGDVIVKADGAEITSHTELSGAVKAKKAGDKISMEVSRNGQIISLTITLDEATPQRLTDMDGLNQKYQKSLPTFPYYNSGSNYSG